MVRPVRPNILMSYADGSVTTSRVSETGQVNCGVLDKDILVLQVGSWALGSYLSPFKTTLFRKQ